MSMNRIRVRHFIIGGAMIVGLGLATLVPAFAKGPVASATEKAAETDFIKTSDDVLKTLSDVRATRLAIFNGMPDEAKKFVGLAETDMKSAKSDAAKYAVDVKASSHSDDFYVPFDVNLSLSDSFVVTPEKAEQIGKANTHLSNGEKREAMEVLKLAAIDVSFQAALLPVNLADQHLQDAVKLIDTGDYYEANLALKAIEDLVVVDSFGIEEVPTAHTPLSKTPDTTKKK